MNVVRSSINALLVVQLGLAACVDESAESAELDESAGEFADDEDEPRSQGADQNQKKAKKNAQPCFDALSKDKNVDKACAVYDYIKFEPGPSQADKTRGWGVRVDCVAYGLIANTLEPWIGGTWRWGYAASGFDAENSAEVNARQALEEMLDELEASTGSQLLQGIGSPRCFTTKQHYYGEKDDDKADGGADDSNESS